MAAYRVQAGPVVATWKEARLAKEARLRRERRYFTPDKRGPACPGCGGPTSRDLVEVLGTPLHLTCEPEFRALIGRVS